MDHAISLSETETALLRELLTRELEELPTEDPPHPQAGGSPRIA